MMRCLFQSLSRKSPYAFLFLGACVTCARSKDEFLDSGCVKVASNVPDDLINWVLGLMALLGVGFSALGRAQPLERLHMPYFRHIWRTLLTASLGFLLWTSSTGAVIGEWIVSQPRDSRKCDVLRVMWCATPHVIGTASLGVLLLLAVAFKNSVIPAKIIPRNAAGRKIPFSIPSGDSYGNGTVALKSLRLVTLLHMTWLTGIAVSLLFTLRGDVLTGLLSAAGIIAVWTNTLLPEWNPSRESDGQDTKTTNSVGHECIEINASGEKANQIGENYDQTCVIIQPKGTPKMGPRKDTDRQARPVTARMYALANAHAAATDFKDVAFKLETYQASVDDAEKLADIIIDQTELVINRLSGILKDVELRDASHRLAFTALVASVVDSEPWERMENQRTRLRALGIAQAWMYKLVSASGRKVNSVYQLNNIPHNSAGCQCPIHRWSTRHNLHQTAQEEAQYMLGQDVKLPTAVSPDHGRFAQELWTKIALRASGEHRNTSLLISMYLNALHARGAIELSDNDYYPIFDLDLVPFSVDDFSRGCTLSVDVTNADGKPLIDSSAARRNLNGFSSRYNDNDAVRYANQREMVVPYHPKVITHVAIRVLWKAIRMQAIVWVMVSLRLLNQ